MVCGLDSVLPLSAMVTVLKSISILKETCMESAFG